MSYVFSFDRFINEAIDLFEGRERVNWNVAKVRELAMKYGNPEELKKANFKAWSWIKRNGKEEEVWKGIWEEPVWTKEYLQDLAKQFKNKTEFLLKKRKECLYADEQGWLPEFFPESRRGRPKGSPAPAGAGRPGSLDFGTVKRMATGKTKEQFKELENGKYYNWAVWKKVLHKLYPTPKSISKHSEYSDAEIWEILKNRAKFLDVLYTDFPEVYEVAQARQLIGPMMRWIDQNTRWTNENLIHVARECRTRENLKVSYPGAYQFATNAVKGNPEKGIPSYPKGRLDLIFQGIESPEEASKNVKSVEKPYHTLKTQALPEPEEQEEEYTKDEVYDLALSVGSLYALKGLEPDAYEWAEQNSLVTKIESEVSKNIKWSRETLQDLAAYAGSHGEFFKNYTAAWYVALRAGLLKDLFDDVPEFITRFHPPYDSSFGE